MARREGVALVGCVIGSAGALTVLIFYAALFAAVVGGVGHLFGWWELPGLAELIDNNTEMEVLAVRCGVDMD